MNASDARQAICRRERKRRSFEQNFHQALSERMKKHVKRISSEESTQNLRDADERYHVKKNETAQRLDQIEKLFRYLYENETYKTD
jgi:lipopolysaccharide export LptBFGC system permease protein LptF